MIIVGLLQLIGALAIGLFGLVLGRFLFVKVIDPN